MHISFTLTPSDGKKTKNWFLSDHVSILLQELKDLKASGILSSLLKVRMDKYQF